jgi:hypothetical protein
MMTFDDLITIGPVGFAYALTTVHYIEEINAGDVWSLQILSDWPTKWLS